MQNFILTFVQNNQEVSTGYGSLELAQRAYRRAVANGADKVGISVR